MTGAESADLVQFDPSFFAKGSAPLADLARFSKSGFVPAGTYRADIVVNKQWVAREDIVFAPQAGDNDKVLPCFDAVALTRYGLDLAKIAARTKADPALKPLPQAGRLCGALGDYIKDATADFDMSTSTLSLSVPQVDIARSARGYVDPSQWDRGMDAAVLGYNGNIYRTSGAGYGSMTTAYLGLDGALDLGPWHLYHLGALGWTDGQKLRYQSSQTLLEHDIPSLRSRVDLGQSYTQGDIFESVRITGARFYSDETMLPPSQRGFAPAIHGIASTNAKVSVYQRGVVIYETEVAPGAFEINDLYQTGYSGDLDVKITEADGSVKWLKVPFSAVPRALRTGQSRWSLTAGLAREYGYHDAPWLVQGTYQRGLSNTITGYGGATVGDNYWALAGGVALNTSIGAFSADYTRSYANIGDTPAVSGGSLRVSYSKNLVTTGTNFSLATYRYSSAGYVGLSDLVTMRNAAAAGGDPLQYTRQRSRFDLTLNQNLGRGWGQLYGTGSMISYWGHSGTNMGFSTGYSNNWRRIGFGISAQRTWIAGNTGTPTANAAYGLPQSGDNADRSVTTVMFNLSLPLGRSPQSPTMTGSYSYADDGGSSAQMNIAGNVGANNEFSYGLNAATQSGSTIFGLSGGYQSGVGQISASYSHGRNYDGFGGSVSGSVVVHGGGVTLGPSYSVGNTIGLVSAPDAEGASVSGSNWVKVDSHGYAVVPNLTPYQLNDVTLDSKNTDAGLELQTSHISVAPRAGGVSKLVFKTSRGRAVIVNTRLPSGSAVPFGADVLDSAGVSVGAVGQASRLILNGLLKSDTVTVRWGPGAEQSCRVKVDLAEQPNHAKRLDFEELNAVCTADPSAQTVATPTALPSQTVSAGPAPRLWLPHTKDAGPSAVDERAVSPAPLQKDPAPASVMLKPPTLAAVSPGAQVVIGSFASAAAAEAAWGIIAERVPELAHYDKSVTSARVGGRSFYRLAARGADLHMLTAKLKAAAVPFWMTKG